MNKQALHVFLILEISHLYEYFLSIQTIQFLILAYFLDYIFCIINKHHFGIYIIYFKKHTVYFILYE